MSFFKILFHSLQAHAKDYKRHTECTLMVIIFWQFVAERCKSIVIAWIQQTHRSTFHWEVRFWSLNWKKNASRCPNITYFTWKFLNPTDDRENYSQYFDRRSRNKDECLMSTSDQWVDPSLASGLTYFSKVRIDLHSLQVIIDDFTFARTSGKRQQPFASAGDCFSATQRCPQGAFSINLENTKFRIRPKTRWETRGMNAIQHFYGVSFFSVFFSSTFHLFNDKI